MGPRAAPLGKAGAQVGGKANYDFCPMLVSRLQCRQVAGVLPLAALLKLVQIYSGSSNPLFCYITFQLLIFPSLTIAMCNQILYLHVYPVQLKRQTAL